MAQRLKPNPDLSHLIRKTSGANINCCLSVEMRDAFMAACKDDCSHMSVVMRELILHHLELREYQNRNRKPM